MEYKNQSREQKDIYDMTALKNCTSLHGYIRTMERAQRNGKQAMRLIWNAWARGKQVNELQTLKQRRYASRYNSLLADGYTNLRIYDGYLFIFSSSGKLITMHLLPQYFFKRNSFDGKTKIRDVKKYMRLNHDGIYADEHYA